MTTSSLTAQTARLAKAFLRGNAVEISDLPALLMQIHATLVNIAAPAPAVIASPTPAVSVRASVKADKIVCLECGKGQKMLKRHLDSAHGLTPDEYRSKWSLPRDYPMVAAEYASRRSALAKAAGLGLKHKRRPKEAAGAAQGETKPGFQYPTSRWAKPATE